VKLEHVVHLLILLIALQLFGNKSHLKVLVLSWYPVKHFEHTLFPEINEYYKHFYILSQTPIEFKAYPSEHLVHFFNNKSKDIHKLSFK
jgi:hypothetical protein